MCVFRSNACQWCFPIFATTLSLGPFHRHRGKMVAKFEMVGVNSSDGGWPKNVQIDRFNKHRIRNLHPMMSNSFRFPF